MRNLRTQEDIMAAWKGDPEKPVVSICCITYNHEPYIEDALEGFLIQETDFPFEILIHDDASTDRTAEIIREYEAKYPKLIKPIYQVENQYSQGKRINAQFNVTRAHGDYMALCEGDDYWISPNKLSIQYAKLQEFNCDICFHPVKVVESESDRNKVTYEFNGNLEKTINPSEVIRRAGPYMPACSIMMRLSLIRELLNKNETFFNERLAHYGYQFIGVSVHPAIYLPTVFGVYRSNHPGSWTRKNRSDATKFLENCKFFCDSILILNDYTKQKYQNDVSYVLKKKILSVFSKREISLSQKRLLLESYVEQLPSSFFMLLKISLISRAVLLFPILWSFRWISKVGKEK